VDTFGVVSLLAHSLNLWSMILNVVLGAVSFLITGVAALLPTYTIFPALASQVATFMGYVNGWDWLVPIDTLVAVMGVLVLLVLVEFTYFVAMYVLSVIHASIRG